MVTYHPREWWVLALRGVIAVLLGILILFWPGITLLVMLMIFGIFALLDGAFSLYHGITGARRGERRMSRLLIGLASIAAGIVTLVWPALTAVVLVYIIAAWAVIIGILEIVGAIQSREQITGEWMLALAGALLVLLGVLLFANPLAGALALTGLIGGFFLVYGVILIVRAFQVSGRPAVT